MFGSESCQKKVPEISNLCFSVRVSQNPKNVIFELAKFLVIFFDGEHDGTIGKMIWRRERVEKPFFLKPVIFRPSQIT